MTKAETRVAGAMENYREFSSPSTERTGAETLFTEGAGAEACHFLGYGEKVHIGEAVTITCYGVSDGASVALFSLDAAGTEIVGGHIATIGAGSDPGGWLGTAFHGNFVNAVSLLSSDQDQIASLTEPAPPADGENTIPSLPETDRLALLDSAALPAATAVDPIRAFEERSRDLAFEILGGEAVLGRQVRSDEDLVQALMAGFPAQVLRSLQDAGYPHKVLEQVIAPRRTLMRRRASKQRLTRAESDSAWRLAHVLVMASHVLNGPQSAIAWLTRAKPAFGGQAPVDLLETSVGATHVERLLRRLDWGDIA